MPKTEKEEPFAAEGRLFAAALDERGIGPSEFARMLQREYGLRGGPQNIQNWRRGRGFNEKNRRLCASLLGLPGDAFDVGSPAGPTTPTARHPWLAKLLAERPLRRFTQEALRALETVNPDDPGEHYWRTQADMHEGIAATAEAARFKPVSKTRKLPANRN